MQPDHRDFVGALPPDDQRGMFAQVCGGTEDRDLGMLGRGGRQARARGDAQGIGRGECREVSGCDDDRFIAIMRRVEQEGGQHPGAAGNLQRGARPFGVGQAERAKRALHGVRKVERGIGNGARQIEREGLAPLDQHRRVRHRCVALVGELERLRACRRNEHPAATRFGIGGGLCREQDGAVVDPDRPAVAERVDRLRECPRIAR